MGLTRHAREIQVDKLNASIEFLQSTYEHLFDLGEKQKATSVMVRIGRMHFERRELMLYTIRPGGTNRRAKTNKK